ncbi:MAG: hypothetical protein K0R66_1196 [Gammaproteobacteria bacterium]|jgi:hypothetical protein|nr:hypothetical protein [Gammaproteobacteria bacterium]
MQAFDISNREEKAYKELIGISEVTQLIDQSSASPPLSDQDKQTILDRMVTLILKQRRENAKLDIHRFLIKQSQPFVQFNAEIYKLICSYEEKSNPTEQETMGFIEGLCSQISAQEVSNAEKCYAAVAGEIRRLEKEDLEKFRLRLRLMLPQDQEFGDFADSITEIPDSPEKKDALVQALPLSLPQEYRIKTKEYLESDRDLDSFLNELRELLPAEVFKEVKALGLPITQREKEEFLYKVRPLLTQYFSKPETIAEFAQDIVYAVKQLPKLKQVWAEFEGEVISQKLQSAEDASHLAKNISKFLEEVRRQASDVKLRYYERMQQTLNEPPLTENQRTSIRNSIFGADSYGSLLPYLVSADLSQVNKLYERIIRAQTLLPSDASEAFANIFLINEALKVYLPELVIQRVYQARIIDLDDQVIRALAAVNIQESEIAIDEYLFLINKVKPRHSTRLEYLSLLRDRIEKSPAADQNENYSKLCKSKDLQQFYTSKEYYAFLLSITVHPKSFDKKIQLLGAFSKEKGLDPSSREFWQSETSETEGAQLQRLKVLQKMMGQLNPPAPLLSLIDNICSIKSYSQNVQAVQRHLIRNIIKDSKELNDRAKSLFDQGLKERRAKPGNYLATIMPIAKIPRAYKLGAALGFSLAVIVIAGIAIAASFSPAIIALAALGGPSAIFAGAFVGLKIVAAIEEKLKSRRDAKIAEVNELKAVPSKIADEHKISAEKKEKAYRFSIGFAVGTVLVAAALGVGVVFFPPLLVALPFAKAIAVLAGSAVGALAVSITAGIGLGKFAEKMFGHKARPSRPSTPARTSSASSLTQPLLEGQSSSPAAQGSINNVAATPARPMPGRPSVASVFARVMMPRTPAGSFLVLSPERNQAPTGNRGGSMSGGIALSRARYPSARASAAGTGLSSTPLAGASTGAAGGALAAAGTGLASTASNARVSASAGAREHKAPDLPEGP